MVRLRWIFAFLGAVLLWVAGISLFRAPEHEVLYTSGEVFRHCFAVTCTSLLRLELGNTGTAPQQNVRVRFRAAPLRGLELPVTVRNFGTVDRAVKTSEADGQRVYDLGTLEPQKRVEFKISFITSPGDAVPSWDEILVGVEPATGEARRGDPGLVAFARMMHAFFGWL